MVLPSIFKRDASVDQQKPSKLFKSNSCAVVVLNQKTQLKRTANRHYLLVSLPEPLPLASLVLRHAWFEHASLKCKANVKKGDYVSDFIHDSGKSDSALWLSWLAPQAARCPACLETAMPYHPSTTDEWFCQAFSSEMQTWTFKTDQIQP